LKWRSGGDGVKGPVEQVVIEKHFARSTRQKTTYYFAAVTVNET